MRTFKALSTVALSACWAEILEESSLLQINNLKGDADSDCFRKGRCGPGSTTAPPTLAPTGICSVSGDPHIKVFDSPEVNVHYFYNGDYYLVKSQFVNIQARYWSSAKSGKSSIKALAIGGDIMEGRVLTIEPGNGMIRLDGQEVTLAESGSITIGTGTLSSTPAAPGEKKGPTLTLEFPDDDVAVKVKRLTELLNVIIEMRPEEGQDGHCGNFNGQLEDDDLGSIKSRMGTSLRFPETMFPIMAATLQGCASEAYGQEVGTNLNQQECNMICSQRGSTMMAKRDETCFCGTAAAPKLFQNGCKTACGDPSQVDPGFCVYSMAKPDPADQSNTCVLDEQMVLQQCKKVFALSSDVESCKIDICSNGDLKGTLEYLSDWKAKEQKESKKLEAKKQKEKGMTADQRQKQNDRRKAARARKEGTTKTTREKNAAAAKAKKQKERAQKEMKNKNDQQEKKNKAERAQNAKQNDREAEKNREERERAAAEKKKKAQKDELQNKNGNAEVSKKKKAALEEKKNKGAEVTKKKQAKLEQMKNKAAEETKKKQAERARAKAERENKESRKKVTP